MHDGSWLPRDLLDLLKPDSLVGAIIYFVLVCAVAVVLTRALRAAVRAAIARDHHIDRTAVSFLQQIGSALIWVIMFILYAHLIPELRALGTALLAGAGVASVVIGLAAQSTLGNLVAGISMTIYRPFRLGDTLQVAAPTGTEIGTVDKISLGYTTLRVQDGRFVVLPNSVAASQVAINLSPEMQHWPLLISIRLPRGSDLEAARKLAQAAATEVVGDASFTSCFLARVDAAEAQLDLRFMAKDAASRDAQRSAVMMNLDRRFAAASWLDPAQHPTFS